MSRHYLKDASTAADLRYTIVKGIQKWYLTDDVNDAAGLIPNHQRLPTKSVEYNTSEDFPRPRTRHKIQYRRTMDERANLSLSSGRKAISSGTIGVHPQTPQPLTASTSLAPVLDRQNKTTRPWHTQVARSC
jgi:hypothetical protein